MLVVLVVADVIADVVQKSGVRQDSSVIGRATQPLANGVEQLQGQRLNVLRVDFFLM